MKALFCGRHAVFRSEELQPHNGTSGGNYTDEVTYGTQMASPPARQQT